jgi:hypothetical protein
VVIGGLLVGAAAGGRNSLRGSQMPEPASWRLVERGSTVVKRPIVFNG